MTFAEGIVVDNVVTTTCLRHGRNALKGVAVRDIEKLILLKLIKNVRGLSEYISVNKKHN